MGQQGDEDYFQQVTRAARQHDARRKRKFWLRMLAMKACALVVGNLAAYAFQLENWRIFISAIAIGVMLTIIMLTVEQ